MTIEELQVVEELLSDFVSVLDAFSWSQKADGWDSIPESNYPVIAKARSLLDAHRDISKASIPSR